jgi:hypothetical protein
VSGACSLTLTLSRREREQQLTLKDWWELADPLAASELFLKWGEGRGEAFVMSEFFN